MRASSPLKITCQRTVKKIFDGSDDSDVDFEDRTPRIHTIKSDELQAEIQRQAEMGKYCIVFDQTDSAPKQFGYKGSHCEFYKELVKPRPHAVKKSQCLEVLRQSLMHSLYFGETFCLNVGGLLPEFTQFWSDENQFPTDLLFDF